ncbi:hypothetical protein M413DRAFT_364949 [Hebeloma cylindrosporum]|uniref:Uncharacterized protein n=1 Tax=Hebeloma cylindrosporum TaxID=76867 RepID=A0A0C3CL77_HEBCY|nr:hypothetical protein M413DRAFT_364949 [Hebeloma cylindrosporum h7]
MDFITSHTMRLFEFTTYVAHLQREGSQSSTEKCIILGRIGKEFALSPLPEPSHSKDPPKSQKVAVFPPETPLFLDLLLAPNSKVPGCCQTPRETSPNFLCVLQLADRTSARFRGKPREHPHDLSRDQAFQSTQPESLLLMNCS